MARNARDNTNDVVGGRDSLGPVHPLSVAEQKAATETVTRLGKKWGARNRRTNRRRDVAIEEVLLALGLKSEETASSAWKEFNRRRTLATGSNKHWFKTEE